MGLVLRNIRHSFGAGLVVDGASLEAAPGEIVTLFGPSGCGKTTLLRIAAGLEKLQDGAVELDAATLASAQKHTPPEIRPIGFVFQDYVLFPHMSVAENVAFGLAGHARAERAARVAAELGAVGISELSDRYPHQLSGGQQQRVALARSFARQPRAMLLDEPFASIDVALRRRLRAEMRRILKARSTTTVLVTHDPAEAVEIGDRIAVMRAGRIVETGSPEQLYAAPKTVAAASVFPGAQTLACRPVDQGIATEFGALAVERRPADAAFIVIHEGGAAALADENGPCRVVDCRFAGPRWTASLIVDGAEAALKAQCERPLEPGTRARVAFDPARIRVLAA